MSGSSQSSIGVVIGSYGMPSAVALNIAAIRHFNNPDVPILVHDDCTPAERDPTGYFDQLRSGQHGCDLFRTPAQLGHVTGDISCFIEGLKWANNLNLKYLVKFSQRFIFTTRDWLKTCKAEADSENTITASQPSYIGGIRPWGTDGIRTECVLMRVDEWCKPTVFEALRAYPATPEKSVKSVAETVVHPGKPVDRWRIFGPDKARKRYGVLWHDCNNESDYQALARNLNVDLTGFSSAGWNHLLGDKWKLF